SPEPNPASRSSQAVLSCPGGEIGRHAILRGWCEQSRAGSSPVPGTFEVSIRWNLVDSPTESGPAGPLSSFMAKPRGVWWRLRLVFLVGSSGSALQRDEVDRLPQNLRRFRPLR